MRGVNDAVAQAHELARLLKDLRCKINLIPFNPFPASGYERPDDASVRAFQTVLLNAGYAAMLRTTRGEDISAACGQLVGEVVGPDATPRALSDACQSGGGCMTRTLLRVAVARAVVHDRRVA